MYKIYIFFFFFFNDTATTEIYTLSLHDALPISKVSLFKRAGVYYLECRWRGYERLCLSTKTSLKSRDRKSTRLNSSHSQISYAVFCLKKKKKRNKHITIMTEDTQLINVYT